MPPRLGFRPEADVEMTDLRALVSALLLGDLPVAWSRLAAAQDKPLALNQAVRVGWRGEES